MSSITEQSIREHLAGLFAREISLNTFDEWFFAETLDIDHTSDASLQKLVYGIKLLLAEYSHGDWTEQELHQHFKDILRRYDMSTSERLTHITVVNKEPHELLPGEIAYHAESRFWYLGCPNPQCSPDPILPGVATLVDHTVTESNGIITVSPSILCGCGAHYFVEQNNIRWC